MTPKEIATKVSLAADERFGETIERMLTILRNKHTHTCNKECGCEYCQFITGDYVKNKLRLHRLKKYLRHYDNGDYDRIGSDYTGVSMATSSHQFYWNLNYSIEALKCQVRKLKSHKKDLQTNII